MFNYISLVAGDDYKMHKRSFLIYFLTTSQTTKSVVCTPECASRKIRWHGLRPVSNNSHLIILVQTGGFKNNIDRDTNIHHFFLELIKFFE
jgi:hypothetical protein